MDIWDANKLLLFIAFVIPGFVRARSNSKCNISSSDSNFTLQLRQKAGQIRY